jgi:hypothetical protein
MSMPFPGRGKRVGQVVQHCRNFQACGHTVWSAASAVVVPTPKDDGSRHGRFHLQPPVLDAPAKWESVSRFAQRELDAMNRQDRKLAAAGGDR